MGAATVHGEMLAALKAAYDKVKFWPENRMKPDAVLELGQGFVDLLDLRNAVERLLLDPGSATQNQRALEAALTRVWTDFLDANPDGLTSPEDLPDHALITGEQFVQRAMSAIASAEASPPSPDPELAAVKEQLAEAVRVGKTIPNYPEYDNARSK